MIRRSFLLASLAIVANSALGADDILLREADIGGPNEAPEDINLTIEQIARIEDLTGGIPGTARDAALFEKIDPPRLFRETVQVSLEEARVGINRQSRKDRVTEYLNLFGLDFADAATGKPYAYCAAGLSWALCKAYCDQILVSEGRNDKFDYARRGRLEVFQYTLPIIRKLYIRPHPQVEVMAVDARDRRLWRPPSVIPSPGWIVFYNWSGGSRGQHIGIVESASEGKLHTIEFNTSVRSGSQINGGYVARKDRSSELHRVIGFAATY